MYILYTDLIAPLAPGGGPRVPSTRSVISQRHLLVGYGMYRARRQCVCVSSFGQGLAVWVLLPRVDRGRRADRIGIGLTVLVQV